MGTLAGNCNKPARTIMTSIPALAFGTDSKKNLDIAAKFLIAGALPAPGIIAQPTRVPPIPAVALNRGVLATLQPPQVALQSPAQPPALPPFFYSSRQSGTNWHSKFSLLVPFDLRLATMLGDNLPAVLPLLGAVAVGNLATTGLTLPAVAGVSSLEQLIYSLASSNTDVAIESIFIGGGNYLKVSADYTFTVGE